VSHAYWLSIGNILRQHLKLTRITSVNLGNKPFMRLGVPLFKTTLAGTTIDNLVCLFGLYPATPIASNGDKLR
jgi:hypothetical protein